MNRDIELAPAVVFDGQVLTVMPIDIAMNQAKEAPNAVVNVHDVVVDTQVCVESLGRLDCELRSRPCSGSLPSEDLGVRDEMRCPDHKAL